LACFNMAVPTSFPRECGEPTRAGVLTYQPGADSQLRDSTGLTPVSPLSLPIRGLRHPDRYSVMFVLYVRPQEMSTYHDEFLDNSVLRARRSIHPLQPGTPLQSGWIAGKAAQSVPSLPRRGTSRPPIYPVAPVTRIRSLFFMAVFTDYNPGKRSRF